MSYRHITVEPLTPTIGATVHGVNLAEPLADATFREIHDAWMAHCVLFFRDQDMTPEQHLAFGRRFGPLHIHPAAPYAHGNPELMVIETNRDSKRNNGSGWHSDVSADEEPPLGTILHLHEVPRPGRRHAVGEHGARLRRPVPVARRPAGTPDRVARRGITRVCTVTTRHSASSPARSIPWCGPTP